MSEKNQKSAPEIPTEAELVQQIETDFIECLKVKGEHIVSIQNWGSEDDEYEKGIFVVQKESIETEMTTLYQQLLRNIVHYLLLTREADAFTVLFDKLLNEQFKCVLDLNSLQEDAYPNWLKKLEYDVLEALRKVAQSQWETYFTEGEPTEYATQNVSAQIAMRVNRLLGNPE